MRRVGPVTTGLGKKALGSGRQNVTNNVRIFSGITHHLATYECSMLVFSAVVPLPDVEAVSPKSSFYI